MDKAVSVFVLGNHVQACCWHVQRLPKAGETFQATGLSVEPGGKGFNVAIGLRRLGLNVQVMIGCGQDGAAQELLKVLQHEGLSTRHVIQFPGASGWGAGLIGADGQNAIAVYPGANLLLAPSHVQTAKAQIEASQLVYGQFETSVSAVAEAFAIAHAAGIVTVLNPSPWQQPPDSLLHSTHTVLVNETEAQALLGVEAPWPSEWPQMQTDIESQLTTFWQGWPAAQQLVITLGEQGAAMYWREPASHCGVRGLYMPAPAIQALDTVGAGDAFASGFVATWLAQQNTAMSNLKRCQVALEQAHVCGAHLAATQGVLDALPHAAQMIELRERYRPGQALSIA
ncbi:hypothetical protein B9Z51_05690 [Limnohabitans sp. T6-5]|uniref:PfkB family carbohydrate kinase n=1 Tax=Limnohabitans sp. T6-5 TaxID=1100724 RepID=UPI000D3B91F7|nr:PfkB family carbohydrate kinase [Limnohabitans sp. T6-5]PUE11762.1 hypothetical protein B9Z51_05690 [Limnohabitans sp. T6-5]